MTKIVCIKTYRDRYMAEAMRNLLEESGIRTILSADDAGGMHPNLLLVTGGAKILVKEEDAEKASEILERE